ncbi:MAG: outer membrane lipoprotein carrier protein LolA [Myxococcales bacterium]|nr:outer membrane lipoprotein carrier protein LolA [Myxococcota bacterium]MDW8280624.1 outer membrane lipoprotein carrier protein LolA [Myxococcales bacterium]
MWRRIALLSLLLTLGTAPPSPLERLLDRMDAARGDVRTLEADFVQRNRVRLFRQELTLRGRLLYERATPSRLRWEYTAPDPSTVILDGQQAYLRLPGQATQRFDLTQQGTLRAVFDELNLWLGSASLREAEKEYEMSLGGPAVLILRPRPGTPLAGIFSRVEMRLDPRTLLLSGLLLVESGGDEKEIAFTRIVRNVALPREAFRP